LFSPELVLVLVVLIVVLLVVLLVVVLVALLAVLFEVLFEVLLEVPIVAYLMASIAVIFSLTEQGLPMSNVMSVSVLFLVLRRSATNVQSRSS
jgi:hypothetical protein